MAPPQWAYQVENYVTEPDEELVCSICRAVFCDPAMCPCDHVFCKACITKWLQNNRNCPICRKRASMSSIKQTVPIIKNLIMKLQLNCRNKNFGCKAQFSVESSEAHVKECEYEFVQCKNKPCTDKLFRKDVVKHETKDCAHRSIRCKKCKCKIPTSSSTDNHDCIKALRGLLKVKSELILSKTKQIKKLKSEIKDLKEKIKEPGRRLPSFTSRSRNSDTLSSISPDEITINIHDYDSMSSMSTISSDSDMSSDNFYIFTNESLPGDSGESNSFSADMDNENIENENSGEANEYRNAESQTVDLSLNSQLSGNLAYENDSTTVEVPNSVFGDGVGSSRRPSKRRPSTIKPAKRRHPPVLVSSDDDEEERSFPPQLSKENSHGMVDETAEGDSKENSYQEAGPSFASAPFTKKVAAECSKPKKPLSKQKRAKQAGKNIRDNSVSSGIPVVSGSPVFERTLALLEQYNLESDPEWLPEYASHRGNDTTTDSDSSFRLQSSSSEISEVDSLESTVGLDGPLHRDRPDIFDLMNWTSESDSAEDPDYRPINFDED